MKVPTNPLLKSTFILGMLAAAAPLAAQTTAPAAPATKSAPAPAAPTTAASYSDDDVKQFAAAAIEVTKLQSDTSIPAADKQPKMLAVLQAKGIAPEKFNAIGQAAAADPALQQRIQAAASASAPAPAAAPATSAAPAAPASPAQPPQ